jgi:hypothetical protein
MLIEKSSDLIVNRTRELLACGIVPQPTKRRILGRLMNDELGEMWEEGNVEYLRGTRVTRL